MATLVCMLVLCASAGPGAARVAFAAEVSLRGGGSTLVNPLMRKWIGEYKKTSGVLVEYEPSGSGKGITGMMDRSYDFGCSDAPMNEKEVAAAGTAGGAVVHVPAALGAVAAIYNLPEVEGRIRFSGPLLAAIFLGRIVRWNAAELRSLNPSLVLPDREITVVHRLDSSGTTYVWTDYLAKVDPQWQSRIGVGKTVPWPVGIAAKGNEGVAGLVKQVPWSIGYAQVTYGIRESLAYGSIENAAGEFIEPLPGSITAAAEGVSTAVPDDLRFSMTNGPGKGAYPVSTVVWALAYTAQPGGKRKLLTDFLRWVIHDGQAYGEALDFAPLPADLVRRGDEKLRSLEDGTR